MTNDFQNDAREAAVDPEFQPVSVVRYHKKSYTLMKDAPADFSVSEGKAKTKRYARQTSHGIEYTENEDYFIFKRCLVHSQHYD